MKQKVLFGLQVFTTLIVIVTIFVSYLTSGVKAETRANERMTETRIEGKFNFSSLVSRTLPSLTDAISCGK